MRPFILREYLEEFVKKCKSIAYQNSGTLFAWWARGRLIWKGFR